MQIFKEVHADGIRHDKINMFIDLKLVNWSIDTITRT